MPCMFKACYEHFTSNFRRQKFACYMHFPCCDYRRLTTVMQVCQNMTIYCHEGTGAIMVHLPVELGAWISNSCIHRWLYKMHTHLLEAEFGEFLCRKLFTYFNEKVSKRKQCPILTRNYGTSSQTSTHIHDIISGLTTCYTDRPLEEIFVFLHAHDCICHIP